MSAGAAGCNKSNQSLEELDEIAQRIDGDGMTLSLKSKVSESFLKPSKAKNSSDVNDVSLELTLAWRHTHYEANSLEPLEKSFSLIIAASSYSLLPLMQQLEEINSLNSVILI